MDDPGVEWILWQLADSAFPCGGFNHSGGLEAAIQNAIGVDLRNDEAGIDDQVEWFVRQSLENCAVVSCPFVVCAFELGWDVKNTEKSSANFTILQSKLEHLDNEFDIRVASNAVACMASQNQGATLLSAFMDIFGEESGNEGLIVFLRQWKRKILLEQAFGHLPIVFGCVFGLLAKRVDRETVVHMFQFWHIRGLISAAVRLGSIGPMEAQRLMLRIIRWRSNLEPIPESIDISKIPSTISPLLDLCTSLHSGLYSRQFTS
uniref:Urease accessory protein UreF n=1 Tax=Timspurckia oligopyrenoides TaxID=708627 RepID=A0A6T6MDP3_9RHOD|mmetsp:Transcript_2971/g.5231  ORF Transcript_2971/g.5231 Transcript_2971/m.5231 type:complete len:262 (+) Transcript_2971:3-788(+)